MYVSSTIKPGTQPPATYGSLKVTGIGKGILCTAETVEHELYHLTIYDDQVGKSDSDGDLVSDASEPNLTGVDSSISNPDTYSMGGSYINYGDNEVRCRKKELSLSFTIYPERIGLIQAVRAKINLDQIHENSYVVFFASDPWRTSSIFKEIINILQIY